MVLLFQVADNHVRNFNVNLNERACLSVGAGPTSQRWDKSCAPDHTGASREHKALIKHQVISHHQRVGKIQEGVECGHTPRTNGERDVGSANKHAG